MTNTQPMPGIDLDEVIGENIQFLMWRNRDSQVKVAVMLGMTQGALSNKLRGKRPWFAAEIDAVARHYRVTRDALFVKLPDLDSNQEPAGYALAPVSHISERIARAQDADLGEVDAVISPLRVNA